MMRLRQPPQLRRMKDPLETGNRRIADRQLGRESGKRGSRGYQVAAVDPIGGNRMACHSGVGSGRETHRKKGREQQAPDHCVSWFTCWHISSAAFTTRELAS